MRLGILGPEGTFTEIAALRWLKSRRERNTNAVSENAVIKYYETIFDVSEGIVRKEVDYGIIPIENSLEGSVGETLDVLSGGNGEGAIQIVGEILVQIRICLLSKQKSKKSDFTKIQTLVSHPQALAQCKRFIRERLRIAGVKVKSVDSTAIAARCAEENDTIAALASKEAAKKYNLTILAEDLQDQDSVTRFIVLSTFDNDNKTMTGTKTNKIRPEPSGKDKTSVLMYLKDYPGALYDALGEFARRGVNLTKIESRPSRRALGDYMFHIDCEGHIEDEKVKEALKSVERQIEMLKILGSYPVGLKYEE
ncbi:MAG: prephenate dehydratase [Methanophagales archaeon]|nr:prephenate dehydratase [Methanophagales archaeon]